MREEDDELVGVRHSTGEDDILMVSRKGQADPLPASRQARPMGRDTAGVEGMGLRAGDEVISVDVIGVDEADLLVVTENGYGKRTQLADYPRQGPRRPGREDRAARPRHAATSVGARIVRDGYQVMLISNGGTVIKIPVDGRQAARPVDAGRDRDAPARGRAGFRARSGGRGGRG